MIFFNHNFENKIDFQNENFATLIIEDPEMFFKFCLEIKNQTAGQEGHFVLLENHEEISMEKYADIILSPFDFDLNSKKIQNLVLKKLYQAGQSDDMIKEFESVSHIIKRYSSKLFSEVDLPIKIEEVSKDDFIKFLPFQISSNATFIENFIDYLNCLAELTKIKILILTNFKTFLNVENLSAFKKHIEYLDFKVLFIENREDSNLFETNPTLIIDADKCEILK